jgi:hypothetical protein
MPLLALAATILARTTGWMIPINIVLFTAYIFILGLANLLHGIGFLLANFILLRKKATDQRK